MSRSGTVVPRFIQLTVLGLFTACALSGSANVFAAADPLQVDFRYHPVTWNTSISLPDDWQKTLVSETGTTLYDYPGPNSRFKTVVTPGIANGDLKATHQRLLNPRTPIVQTTSDGQGVTLTQETFAIVDSPFLPNVQRPKLRLYRVGRELIKTEWATPPAGSDPAFQNIATGQDQPVRYAYDVDAGAARTIAVGLIEGRYTVAGKRPMVVQVEGAAPQTIDVAALVGANHPMVALFDGRDSNGDGRIDVEIKPVTTAPDQNTVVSAIWVFAQGTHPDLKKIVTGSLNASAEAYASCGENTEAITFAPRRDVLHLDYKGPNIQPVVRIQTTRKVVLDAATGVVSLNGRAFLTSQPAPTAAQTQGAITTLVYPLSTQQINVVIVNAPSIPASALQPIDFNFEHDRAVTYWKNANLPWNRIHVPDTGIQAILDSSVRNIFQARDIRGGKAEFRVGPTVYRDIWLIDGSFLLDVATQLGAVADARRAIERIMDYQQPSGQFIVLQPNFYKETGIALWILQRHALLTQDKPWLEAHWQHVRDGVKWMKAIRKEASVDPKALYAGLIPPGHSDGGIEGANAEYTNIYWSLNGLKAAIDSAKWLGKIDEAKDWQIEYDDFMTTFQRAAARDMKIDAHGNRYLPILMNPGPNDLAQKAQWGFCHAIFPGKILASNDPIATGTLAMLDTVNSEGLVVSTGWMNGGIWTYFASFYAHAHLWMGGPDHTAKAQQILYAFANHASPLLVWREEQKPVGQGPEMVGDMPHNWASAEFIRLVRDMIALERGENLVLFAGIPANWVQPGQDISLNSIATEFGQLSVRASTSTDGQTELIELSPIGVAGQPGAPTIDLKVFKSLGFKSVTGDVLPDQFAGAWGQPLRLELKK